MLTRPDTPMDEDGWGDVLADLRRLDMRVSGGGQDIRNDAPQWVSQKNADNGYGGEGGDPGTAGGNVVVANYVGSSQGNIYISNRPPDQINNVLFFNPVTNKIEWTNVNNKVDWQQAAASLTPYLPGASVTVSDSWSGTLYSGMLMTLGTPGEGSWYPAGDWSTALNAYNPNRGGIFAIVDTVSGQNFSAIIFGPVALDGRAGAQWFPWESGAMVDMAPWDIANFGTVHMATPIASQLTTGIAFVHGFRDCFNPVTGTSGVAWHTLLGST